MAAHESALRSLKEATEAEKSGAARLAAELEEALRGARAAAEASAAEVRAVRRAAEEEKAAARRAAVEGEQSRKAKMALEAEKALRRVETSQRSAVPWAPSRDRS